MSTESDDEMAAASQEIEALVAVLGPEETHNTDFFTLVMRMEEIIQKMLKTCHNTLQKVVPELCRKAGITGHKTNHSLRVSTATKLYENGVPEQLIMERTGHRTAEGVKTYKRTSEDQKEDISAMLNRTEVPTEEASKTVTDTSTTSVCTPTSSGLIMATNCVINVMIKNE